MKSALKGAIVIALSSFLAVGHVYAQSTSALVAQIQSAPNAAAVEAATRNAIAALTSTGEQRVIDEQAILTAALNAVKGNQAYVNAVARGAAAADTAALDNAFAATQTFSTATVNPGNVNPGSAN